MFFCLIHFTSLSAWCRTWWRSVTFKSTPSNGPRFTALGLPWWSPIQLLTEVVVSYSFRERATELSLVVAAVMCATKKTHRVTDNNSCWCGFAATTFKINYNLIQFSSYTVLMRGNVNKSKCSGHTALVIHLILITTWPVGRTGHDRSPAFSESFYNNRMASKATSAFGRTIISITVIHVRALLPKAIAAPGGHLHGCGMDHISQVGCQNDATQCHSDSDFVSVPRARARAQSTMRRVDCSGWMFSEHWRRRGKRWATIWWAAAAAAAAAQDLILGEYPRHAKGDETRQDAVNQDAREKAPVGYRQMEWDIRTRNACTTNGSPIATVVMIACQS